MTVRAHRATFLAVDLDGDLYGIGETADDALADGRRVLKELIRAESEGEMVDVWREALASLRVVECWLPRSVMRGLTEADDQVRGWLANAGSISRRHEADSNDGTHPPEETACPAPQRNGSRN
jgi:hypothetical protein